MPKIVKNCEPVKLKNICEKEFSILSLSRFRKYVITRTKMENKIQVSLMQININIMLFAVLQMNYVLMVNLAIHI